MTDKKIRLRQESNIEEIIATLWLIATLIAFSNGYTFWGYLFAAKTTVDIICSVGFAVKCARLSEREKAIKRVLDKKV